MTSNTLRLFIAIELDPSVREAIGIIQDHLRKSGADVKWVKPDDIHLTLKFLGDTPTDIVDKIANAMQESVQSVKKFLIEITGLGAFPKISSPRIIWVGIENGRKEVKQIAASLEEKLETLGIKKEEREFSAHITVGRTRSPQNIFALSKILKEFKSTAPITQEVSHITLIKSTLTAQGPVYEVLRRADFGNSRA
ncbi:MAG TPA: RNA 2',3'-cyclic phosphodiesterase [Candidatus Omnitrophota bacterium]|nr:RNA 2',3'-cyclic phosphodiesterase [Candidatus Omnitrophota bacterium]HPD85074.1 RNA 2',3'-cyclic phosphodiesterase [Candidatus Omnitrophota bacterium]HRZ03932.1 RNA 2',3'-cyclic phosphodiesterase [Candidatus Omnitrophota bacterium]